jgi:hypothetical protein
MEKRKQELELEKKLDEEELLEEEAEEKMEEEAAREAENSEEASDIEYEIVEREILPAKIICPDCGGITLEGLDFCDKCGGELH